MTKTPEELTEDWKAGKLDWNKFYYIKLTSGEICIDYAHGAYFIKGKPQEITMDYTTNNDVKQILAPVPTYDEYKAIQEELAEHRYYCCCMENEVMRLDKAKLEEEIAKLKEKIKKKEELIQCLGSNIDELDVKKSVLIIENNKLRGLLKECKEELEYHSELIFCELESDNSKIEFKHLLTHINAALGGSEVK